MKNLLFIIASPLLLTAQHNPVPESEVPESVRTSFNKIFNGAKAIRWEREKYGLYEAELQLDGRTASATFNANGLLQRAEREVPLPEMPGEVTSHAKKMFPDHTIKECQLISTPDERTLFEVEMQKGDIRKSLIFDENNNFLRVEVDEDDDDLRSQPAKKG